MSDTDDPKTIAARSEFLCRIIDSQRARVIRTWRVDLHCTYGRVSEMASRVWGNMPPGGGQVFGRDICTIAARTLGEDPDSSDWN